MAFEHITLNTGDSLTRDNTVELVAVEVIKPIVADLIQPDGEDRDLKVALPGFESYRVKAGAARPAMPASLFTRRVSRPAR